jgi:predicted nucleic acid-binding protein
MSLLVDSDVVINILRGRRGETEILAGLLAAGEAVFFSPITRAAVFAGMRANEEGGTRKLFRLMQCLAVSDAVGEIAGGYLKVFSRSHGREIADALLAATARRHGLRFWTMNKKHYPMADLVFFEG